MIVAHYFASDVHLRFDRPDRDRRFSNWLTRLTPDDSLLIAGDLCDFWMASREPTKRSRCKAQSLRRLAEFRPPRRRRCRSCPATTTPGSAPFTQNELGARIVPDPFDLTVYGLRLHVVHGHLLGARRAWKAWLEGPRFFTASAASRIRSPVRSTASLSGTTTASSLPTKNGTSEFFRAYASRLQGLADLVVIGHVHRAVDEAQTNPRMIVLGGWQARSSFLKVDERRGELSRRGRSRPAGHSGEHRSAGDGASTRGKAS